MQEDLDEGNVLELLSPAGQALTHVVPRHWQ